jgi:hypothetical protein
LRAHANIRAVKRRILKTANAGWARVTINDDDDLNYASLLKRAGVRMAGTTCTCAIAVVLGLVGFDALAQHALSRAAGIADAHALVSRWLPARVPPAEDRKLASLAPITTPGPIAVV